MVLRSKVSVCSGSMCEAKCWVLQLQRETRTLTEGFFLYRLVVFCPDVQNKSRVRQQTKTQEEHWQLDGQTSRDDQVESDRHGRRKSYFGPAIRRRTPNFSGAWNVGLIVGRQTTSVRFGGGPWLR